VVLGLVVGSIAGRFVPHGRAVWALGVLAGGVVGGVLGGWVLDLLGVGNDANWLGALVVGTIGAVGALGALRVRDERGGR